MPITTQTFGSVFDPKFFTSVTLVWIELYLLHVFFSFNRRMFVLNPPELAYCYVQRKTPAQTEQGGLLLKSAVFL